MARPLEDIFDEMKFFDLVDSCSTYEELRVRCDSEFVECILTEDEFKKVQRQHVRVLTRVQV